MDPPAGAGQQDHGLLRHAAGKPQVMSGRPIALAEPILQAGCAAPAARTGPGASPTSIVPVPFSFHPREPSAGR
jgi:hypothetical protein